MRNKAWKPWVAVLAGICGVTLALQLGALLGGTPAPSWNPLGGLLEIALGRVPATGWTWALLVLMVLGVVFGWAWWGNSPTGSAPGGEAEANRRIGRAAEFPSSRESARLRETREVLHPGNDRVGPGLPLAKQGRHLLYQGWRQCSTHIWAPGRGKTTAEVVPHAIAAPGAYVMTTNKTDGVWEVIAARSPKGRIWICDPNNVLRRKEPFDARFPILEMVKDSLSAEKVGELFEKSTHGPGADAGSVNAHFDREGSKTLGRLMLAAHLAGKTDTDVYDWAMNMNERAPADLLREHSLDKQASALEGLAAQPGDTRGSVWATAQRCASPFEHEEVLDSFRLEGAGAHKVFNARKFIQSSDTLILIGDRLQAGTSAFVSALVWQVFTEAVTQAGEMGGRLRTPLVMDLDEIGNAVMLPELPDWYSYAGSRGIVISSYFQSAAQGRRQFGKEGFDAQVGASNAFIYGGGSSDPKFLEEIGKLVGDYEHQTKTSSSSYADGSGHSRSTSDQQQRRDILSVAQLARLSRGTMLLSTSEGGTGLAQAAYWFENKNVAEDLSMARKWLIERECRLSEAQVDGLERDREDLEAVSHG